MGYNKLISFRVGQTGGYEWFGSYPPSESLSAYGLMQFSDMSKVTQLVDKQMVADLQAWLVSRKTASGSFTLSTEALDTFGRAPQNVTDAYIVWSLLSSGAEVDLTSSLNSLIVQAN